MTQARFLHLGVSISGSSGGIEKALIEERLNKAKDWLRYAPNCWLIYTAKSPVHWANVLKSTDKIKEGTTFFICEVNLKERSGWLHEEAWKWIDKARGAATGNAEL